MEYFRLILLSSLDDFRRNKLRTFLTSLGIMIGVSSVILLIALGLGLKKYIKLQFEGLGVNIAIVMPGNIFNNGNIQPGRNVGGIKFDQKDVQSIKTVAGIKNLAPTYIKTVAVKTGGNSQIGDLYATNEEIFPMRNLELAKGSYYSKSDVAKSSKKVVLGPKIAEKLLTDIDNAEGKSIKIENLNFKVVGVLKEKGGGGFGGPDFDSFIYVPYKAVLSLNPDKKFSVINFQVTEESEMDKIKKAVEEKLLRRYEKDDFSIVEQEEIQNTVTMIFSVLNSVLIAIGGISLIVGGIGIMNIMYVSIIERYQEIGIRRALGATKNNILLLFLSEAVLLSLTGGVLGLLLSYLTVLIIRIYFPAYLDVIAVLVALTTSSLIGIIFGVLPAKNAASLSPVEAIRYE